MRERERGVFDVFQGDARVFIIEVYVVKCLILLLLFQAEK